MKNGDFVLGSGEILLRVGEFSWFRGWKLEFRVFSSRLLVERLYQVKHREGLYIYILDIFFCFFLFTGLWCFGGSLVCWVFEGVRG